MGTRQSESRPPPRLSLDYIVPQHLVSESSKEKDHFLCKVWERRVGCVREKAHWEAQKESWGALCGRRQVHLLRGRSKGKAGTGEGINLAKQPRGPSAASGGEKERTSISSWQTRSLDTPWKGDPSGALLYLGHGPECKRMGNLPEPWADRPSSTAVVSPAGHRPQNSQEGYL